MKPGKLLKNKFMRAAMLALAFNAVATAPALAQKTAAPKADRHAAIVVEANSGRVLYENDADERLYPASTTKMMTAYLVFEALHNGTLKTDDILTVSRNAAMQERTNLAMMSAVKLRKGHFELRQNTTKISVENAIRGMLTHSANDAAVVLAEKLGGSEAGFARMMNAAAAKLGMKDTHYTNPNGLPDPQQKSTVEDLALLNRAILREYPQYAPYFNTLTFTFNNHTYHNTNKLLGVYPGMDMSKTGYIGASGWNLAASAVRGTERIIGVIFGARTQADRAVEMQHLLDFGFRKLEEPNAKYAYGRETKAESGERYVRLPAEAVKDSPLVEKSEIAPEPIRLAMPVQLQERDTLMPARDDNDKPPRPDGDPLPKAIRPRDRFTLKGPSVA